MAMFNGNFSVSLANLLESSLDRTYDSPKVEAFYLNFASYYQRYILIKEGVQFVVIGNFGYVKIPGISQSSKTLWSVLDKRGSLKKSLILWLRWLFYFLIIGIPHHLEKDSDYLFQTSQIEVTSWGTHEMRGRICWFGEFLLVAKPAKRAHQKGGRQSRTKKDAILHHSDYTETALIQEKPFRCMLVSWG